MIHIDSPSISLWNDVILVGNVRVERYNPCSDPKNGANWSNMAMSWRISRGGLKRMVEICWNWIYSGDSWIYLNTKVTKKFGVSIFNHPVLTYALHVFEILSVTEVKRPEGRLMSKPKALWRNSTVPWLKFDALTVAETRGKRQKNIENTGKIGNEVSTLRSMTHMNNEMMVSPTRSMQKHGRRSQLYNYIFEI